MRYHCYFCHKSVTTEVPDDTVVRALLVCPECIEVDVMKKSELLNKISDINTELENLKYEFKKNMETLDEIRALIEALPMEEDEIEDDEKPAEEEE